MPVKRTKTAPSLYPRLPFQLIRLAQFCSSLIVASVTGYFAWNLHHEHWPTPWTFHLLLAASILTSLSLIGTGILHACFRLNPRFNAALNLMLLVPWFLGFGMLARWSSWTLGHFCTAETWGSESGIMVCRLYKVLFAFVTSGVFFTLLAILLDVRVFRKSTARGAYNQMPNPEGGHGLRDLAKTPIGDPISSGGAGGDGGVLDTHAPFTPAYLSDEPSRPTGGMVKLAPVAEPEPERERTAPRDVTAADGYAAVPAHHFDDDVAYDPAREMASLEHQPRNVV